MDAPIDPGTTDPASMARCEAWLVLHRALAFEPERASALLAVHADPAEALAAAGVIAALSGPEARHDRDTLARVGASVVPSTHAAYPASLRPLVDAPPVLCVRGDVGVLQRPAVAIVGARAATVEGLDTAQAVAFELARRGLVIVSGLARGIDAAAHRGALEAGGETVAVQACGADRVYPPEHRDLARRIAGQGAVVSELPVGTPPRAPHFPLRNRLISGLALAVIVVEARLRSGSLVTAAHALAQGREVLAVPGALRAPTSEGPNRLLRDGARPMLEADDVIDALPPGLASSLQADAAEPVDAAEPQASPGRVLSARPLDARDRALVAALERCAQGRDGLVRTLGWTVSEVSARLLSLEVEGRVVQDRDGRFKPRSATRRRRRASAPRGSGAA